MRPVKMPMTPSRFLERTARLYRDKVGIVCGAHRETYGDYQARVQQFARAMRDLGIQKGDRIAYLGMNCHRLLEAYFGVLPIGAVLVPLNIRLHPSEIAFILNDAAPRVLIASKELVPLVQAIQDRVPVRTHVLADSDAELPPGWLRFDELLARQPSTPVEPAESDEEDVAEIFYTSGTTGRPKGVMLTHRNLYTHALQAVVALQLQDDDVQIEGTVPLFHVNAWGSPHSLTAVGARHVVVPRFDPETFCRAVQEHRATLALMVPTMLNALLNWPGRHSYDLSSLRRLVLGGAPAPYALVEAARREIGCTTMVGYGLTETSPVLTVAVLKETLRGRPQPEQDRRQAMTGLPVVGVELRVVHEDGSEVKPDGQEMGEIVVRGDSVMKGYWKRPEETEEAFRDGWFHTGDMATVDEEGYVLIVDRKKDIIISGGENISSVEVEECLYSHPAVLECAVIAAPDPHWGEVPKALVVLKPDQKATAEALTAHCRERLAPFKVPKEWVFLDKELPKTGTGKIMKAELRKQYGVAPGRTA